MGVMPMSYGLNVLVHLAGATSRHEMGAHGQQLQICFPNYWQGMNDQHPYVYIPPTLWALGGLGVASSSKEGLPSSYILPGTNIQQI